MLYLESIWLGASILESYLLYNVVAEVVCFQATVDAGSTRSAEVTLFEGVLALAAERSELPVRPLFARQPVLRVAVAAETAGLQATVDAGPAERLDVAGRQRLECDATHSPALRHSSREG